MVFPLLGPIIGAVGSVASAALSKNRKTTTTSTVDYEAMAARAKAAGFNPLTALRNGGAAGFSTQTTAQLGGSSFLADTLTATGNLLADHERAKKENTRADLENKLLAKQIEMLNDQPRFGNNIPRVEYAKNSSGYGGRNTGSLAPSGPSVDPTGNPVTDVGVFGNTFKANPAFSDAELVEQRYGDVASSVYGVTAIIGDTVHNVAPKLPPIGGTLKQAHERRSHKTYDPSKNKPLRGYYGPPGSRTGF